MGTFGNVKKLFISVRVVSKLQMRPSKPTMSETIGVRFKAKMKRQKRRVQPRRAYTRSAENTVECVSIIQAGIM